MGALLQGDHLVEGCACAVIDPALVLDMELEVRVETEVAGPSYQLVDCGLDQHVSGDGDVSQKVMSVDDLSHFETEAQVPGDIDSQGGGVIAVRVPVKDCRSAFERHLPGAQDHSIAVREHKRCGAVKSVFLLGHDISIKEREVVDV